MVTVMSGVSKIVPMHLWCRLLQPAELTLNVQQQSNTVPNVSAYAHIHGQHNFVVGSFAPLGIEVQAYKTPTKRGTWDPHLVTGWNLGTSMVHYRCFRVYVKKTREERVTETIFFKVSSVRSNLSTSGSQYCHA